MSNFPVPKIDQLAGIECYCTCYSGTGGLIKQSSEGFKVSEIIDCSVFDDLSPVQDSSHKYLTTTCRHVTTLMVSLEALLASRQGDP